MSSKKERWKKKLAALKLAIKWNYQASPLLLITVVFITIFGGLITIIEPYIFKLILDRIASKTDLSVPVQVGFSLISIFVIYGVARVFQGLFWDLNNLIRRVQNMKMERHVMYSIMSHISSLDLVYFERADYYNVLSRASSNLWRLTEFFWVFTFLITEGVSSLVIIGALLAFDWRVVALILLGAIPSIIIALKWSSEFLYSAFEQASPIYRHATYYRSLLTEQPEAIKEIRTFGLGGYFLEKFRNLFAKFIQKHESAMIRHFVFYGVLTVIEGSLSVFAAWLVVRSFLEGKISIGDLTFMWAILFQFAMHLRWVIRMITDINTHATFLTPVVEVLDFKPQITDPISPVPFPKQIKKGIELKNVTFYYPNSKVPALKNVNLLIKPKQSIALVGENGSGKTTLIKLLCRLYEVSEGEILVDGINIKNFCLSDLYDNMGIIFQDFMKYEALVKENIAFGRLKDIHKSEQVKQAAIKSGAWNFIKDLEKSYQTMLGKKLKEEGVELSVGQWQKVALARAFFRDAQMLILDEPTAAVDAKAEYDLFKKFRALTKNKITFLISHRFSTVRMADKIVVVDKGRMIESGSHEDLLKKKGTYSKLFKLQAKGYK